MINTNGTNTKTCCLQIKIKIKTTKAKYTMKHMSQTDKAKAIALKLEKVSHKVIAPSLEVPLSSVARLLAQYRKQTGENIPERKKGNWSRQIRKQENDIHHIEDYGKEPFPD